MTIQFLGAAKEVTGSKHLITTDHGKTILLDCGMFQGKGLETDADNRNLGFDPIKLDYIILSHSHIDHSGLIPYLYKLGFRGDVICTPATRDLCSIMLQDTAFIQAQDVRWFNKKMDKLHKPKIQPLYDVNHATQCMKLFITVPYNRKYFIDNFTSLIFTNAGHMLGSAIVNLEFKTKKNIIHLTYTGDIGRPFNELLPPPQPFPQCDYLICESTYGDRQHSKLSETKTEFKAIVEETCIYKQGKLIIPSFSVGRTQEIVYTLNNLYNERYLPKIPVYVDSPLAVNATHIFKMYLNELNDNVQDYLRFDPNPFGFNQLHYITDINESKKLNTLGDPCIIISASGMMEAGRIKHHVANHISDPSTTILIVGYCTPTSLGARIQDPNKQWISIFGHDHKIKAHITKLEGFSGHADYTEIINFMTHTVDPKSIKQTFLVHGEEIAQEAFKQHLSKYNFKNISIPFKSNIFTLE